MSATDDLRTLLDDWKALEAAATPGPWWWDQRGDLRPTPHDEYGLDSLIGWNPIYETPVLSDGDAAFIAASRTLAPRLIAAVEAVLALHRPGDGASQGFTVHGYGYVEPYCAGCEASDEYAVEWPCPTVTALHAALIGDDDD